MTALRAVGEASLSAAVMILAVLVLRMQFQDRTPRRAFCLLWDIVLVRLLVPGKLPSPVSILRLLPDMGEKPAVTALAGQPVVTQVIGEGMLTQETWIFSVEDAVVSSGTACARPPLDWGVVLAAVWLAAALLLAGGFLWSHLRSRRIYAASLPCRDGFAADWMALHALRRPVQVRTSDQITAPLTYGVVYPVILLPSGMDWEDRESLACVLAHEHAHIRRCDALRKMFLAAVLCLHWFNPLVWVMYALCSRDIELACDEAVLRGGADRERYALALLGMEERRSGWSVSGSHFSQNALEARIRAIMKRKHVSAAALIAVLACMSVTTTVFACAAPEGKPEWEQTVTGTACAEVVEDYRVTAMTDGKTGNTLYSVDGGGTWMSEERYHAQYGEWGDGWEVQWWTYKDYKAWLEREKAELQEMIGGQAYTGSEGWFTVDQERVDETIALYEQILEEIGRGALYSRAILDRNGKVVTGVALASDGMLDAVVQSTDQPSSVRVDVFLPSQRDVLAAREQVLAGMTQEQVRALNKTVIAANYDWEYDYLYGNIFGRLEDPDSPAWTAFDQEADELTARMEELRGTVRDEDLRADLQYLIDEARLAQETHGMEHANNLYKMLHDLDYFLLRYGPTIDEGTDTWIQDKSTISKYYGMLSVYS